MVTLPHSSKQYKENKSDEGRVLFRENPSGVYLEMLRKKQNKTVALGE